MKIIDISYANERINWEEVKKDGIEGVIIRVGYGSDNEDEWFQENITQAIEHNLHIGFYWFLYSLSVDEAIEEAHNFNRLIEKYKGIADLPVYADWEYESDEYFTRIEGYECSIELRTQMVKNFLITMEKHGWYAGNYSNLDYIMNKFDQTKLERFDLWYADWRDEPSQEWVDRCGIHQFTEKGKAYGQNKFTDINIMYTDYPNIIRNSALNGFTNIKNNKGIKKNYKLLLKINSTGEEFKRIFSELKQRGFNPETIKDSTAKKVDVNKLIEDIALGQNGWFNVFGEERKNKIEALGLDFDTIQNKVDEYVEKNFE